MGKRRGKRSKCWENDKEDDNKGKQKLAVRNAD